MTTKKGKHGGARTGAGKKSRVYSDFLKKQIVDALKAKAKEEGRTLGDVMVEIAYSDEKRLGNLRPPVFKIICDSLLVKSSEAEVNHNVRQGPAIYLPEIRKPDEDEAEAVVH